MNSIMEFLTFTGESPSDYTDNRLPTLDCNLFISKGKISHSFYEKPMRADKCLDAKTALSESILRSSLSQDIIRRLMNMDLDLPISEKIATLDKFYDEMRNSGHSHRFMKTIFQRPY